MFVVFLHCVLAVVTIGVGTLGEGSSITMKCVIVLGGDKGGGGWGAGGYIGHGMRG